MKIFLRKTFLFFCAVVVLYMLLSVPRLARVFSSRPYLRVLAWTDMINPAAIAQFERETGCDVYVSYVESNEELLGKVRVSTESEYDLIIPSEHAVAVLKAEGRLLPLDKQRLSFAYSRINSRLRSGYYDKDMSFALPYFWAIYGIGTHHSSGTIISKNWDYMFDGPSDRMLAIPNEPRELIALSCAHLYGYEKRADKTVIPSILALLKKVKKHVVAFTDLRPDYLLSSGAVQAAVVTTPFMVQCRRERKPVQFTLPLQGSFMLLDLLAIPRGARITQYLYDFINYIYRPEFIAKSFMETSFIPATEEVVDLLEREGISGDLLRAYKDKSYPLHFFRSNLSDECLGNLWIQTKSS